MEDNKRKLYDALSDEFDLGTYEEFERNIGDSVKRQKLYDAASADYDLGDFESYSQKIGPTHRESLEAFTAEHGSFLNDFEARDSAEIKESRAGMSSGIYIPSKGSITGEERQRYLELHKQEEALKKAWFTSDEYLAQKDADALLLSNIRKNINRESVAFAQANPVLKQEGAFQANPYATRGAEADTELEKYMTASRIMDDAIKMHNAPSRYDGKNVFLKFGKGAGDVLSDADFWTAGLFEIADNFGVRSVLKNVQDKLGNLNDLSEESIENILSPAEKAVLQAWAINAQEQLKRKDDLSRAYQAGQGATESLGFMAEFALTGGVGQLASEGVESMAKWLSKKAMTTVGGMADDVAEKVLKETGEKIARSTAGKYGVRLAESLAEAAGRTGVMPSTFRNISEKATEIETDEEGNNYLVGMNNAFAKGFADSFIENLSEGGRVNALGELIGDVAGKVPAYKRMVDKFSKTKASELLDAFNSSGIMNTLRAGGWHGLGEEYLEEWYGNTLRTLTGVDKEALKEFATVDNQIVTLTSFLPMTIFGGTVGTAQVLSASRDLEKKSAALKSALLERGYDEAQADNMIDMMRGSTPAEVSEFLSPIVNSVAGRSVDEAAALMKPVGEFAAAVRKWQAFDTKYRYQEQEQRDNLRAQMEETLGQFWQEDENGRQTVQRGVNASGESVYLLGKPSADEAEAGVSAEVAAVTSDGRKVFVNPSEYELDDELELNEFLGTEIMAEKGNREKARMVEERDAQNAAIREAAVPGTAINIGTEEAPVQAVVIQRNPDGVIVNTPDGQTRQMTLEEFGNYVGINAVPMTDAQIEEQEAAALSAERAQREAELDQEYSDEDSAYEEIAEAEDEIEQATEAAEVLPLKADGSVDQTALWNRDPERWAAWNNEQRQDGGVNSLAYINGAIAKESARIAEMQAGYDAISDFDERDAVEREVVAVRDRLQRLVDLRDGYVARAEAAQVAAEEIAAEPSPAIEQTVDNQSNLTARMASEMTQQELNDLDEMYDTILSQTRLVSERARLLQEYLDKIAEGSTPIKVLTKQNYENVMRSAGCPEADIAQVGIVLQQLIPGQAIAGFASAGNIFVMADSIPDISEARITYVHERQHIFNATDPQFVAQMVSILKSRKLALEVLKKFVGEKGLPEYENRDLWGLADEIIARSMETAYTTEDFSVTLQSKGIPSEVISTIIDIDNEQRQNQSLIAARRSSYAAVSGRENNTEESGDSQQISSGILGQEGNRPSDLGERGISPRSTGEGAEVISEEQLDAPNSGEPQQITTEDGEVIADTNGKGGVRFSIRTWLEGGRNYLAAWLDKDETLTAEEKADILARMDEFYENAQKYTDTYVPFGKWSEAAVRYDSNGNPLMSVIKANGDYAMNLDFSLVCKKRRPLNRLLRTLINRNAFGTYSLKEREIAEINWILQEHGFEVACALCFVDSKRYRVSGVADVFAALYNKMVKTLAPQGVPIAHFNYYNNPNVEVVENGIDTLADDQLNWKSFEKYARRFKPTSVEGKVAQFLRDNPSQRRLVDATDFIEAEGFEAVKANNQELLKLYNAKKGTGGPKASFGDVQYLNDILKKEKKFDIDKAYSVGGVRIQSFSDFVPHMYFDYMQLFAELAAKKLPAHAYTKEVLFAKIFGLTGVKINLSLVPAVVEGGVAPGLDADGNYAWADAVRDPEGNVIQQAQSFPFDEAMNIQNAPGYSRNCGAIAVGISDEHIEKMLDDPNIQFIIPYHKSSLNAIVARMTNIDQYKDYTNVQTTKKASGTKLDKDTADFNFNEYLHNLGENGTPQQAAQAYLDWCRENNFRPKFSQFAYHPNYYKLLVDFNTIDTTTGEYAPQGAVTMSFPTEQSAFGNVESLIEQGLGEDMQLEEKMEAEVDEIADEVEARLEEISKEPKLSEKQQLKKMAELADERAAQIKAKSEGVIDLVEEARKAQAKHDALRFRVISDENYEMAQRIINNLAGDTYFRRLGGEFELGKLASNYAELADIIMAIDANKNYTPVGTALLGFFAENPDKHYPLLFNDSAASKETSKAFAEELSKVNDPYALLFMKDAWRIHKKSLEQAGLGVKASSTTKYNKAIDARAEEIKAAEVKGTTFNFKKQESSLEEIDSIFKQLNKDPELALLHDRVMSVARTLGVKVSFAGKRGRTAGESLGDKVSYDYKFFNSPAISDQRKCNTIIHELIHSITVYAIYLRSKSPAVLSDGMIEAVDILHDVYNQIARDAAFKGEYGVTDVYEMVAELSNAQFRDKLKEKSLFQRILDALKRLLGIDTVKEDSAYQVLSDTLDYIIDNYDEAAFDAFALYASRSRSYGKMLKIEEAPRFRITPEMDKAYMDAVEAGDMETVAKMVAEAVKLAMPNTTVVDENGYPREVYRVDEYRGNRNKYTNVYGGVFYADTEEYFDHSDTGHKKENAEPFYINTEGFFDPMSEMTELMVNSWADILGKKSEFEKYDIEDESDTDRGFYNDGEEVMTTSTDGLALAAQRMGYKGVILRDIPQRNGNDFTEYAVFNSNAIKSAKLVTYDNDGNVIPLSQRFNPENEDIRFRISNKNQAIFVSNAAKAVEGIKQEKATPEQWQKMIEKAGGLKAGEDKWMGLSDWLKASDKKTLTKAEVLDFINENMIIIEEQHYSDEEVAASANKELNDKYPGWEDAFSFEWDSYIDEPYASVWDAEVAVGLYNDYHEDQIELDEDGEFDSMEDEEKVAEFGKEIAKIYYRGNSAVRPINGIRSDYQTRGLSNNREIALTVPTIESWAADDAVHFGDAGEGRAIAWIRFGETKAYAETKEGEEYKAFVDNMLRRYHIDEEVKLSRFGTIVVPQELLDALTDEQLYELQRLKEASMKASDKTEQNILVIDEIQSKRHQEGREKGYKKSNDEIYKALEAFQSFNRSMKLKYGPNSEVADWDEEDKAEFNRLRDAHSEASKVFDRGIPDAPFDKNWHELAMKRMLRYAAENGYDVIAWTTGDQQASRYDLSKMVKKISVYPSKDGSRIVDLHLVDRENDFKNLVVDSEGMVTFGEYKGRALADVVGKDYSMKIMAATRNTEFSGDNLQVGGEGMRGFYDKMLPAFMNKYGKKWGVKVEDINLPGLANGLTMHSVPVTEEMKASVMEGQVMFRVRGENESALDFHQGMVDDFLAKYNPNTELLVFPVNEETAKRFGYTLEELNDVNGIYVPDKDIIAIFAHEDETDGDEVENTLFHESIHKLATFYPYMRQAGKWMLDNADQDGVLSDYKAVIDDDYSNFTAEEQQEEMLTHVLSGAMSMGQIDMLFRYLPESERDICEQILNEIGYDRERESRERVGRSYQESEMAEADSVSETSGESESEAQEADSEGLSFRVTDITPEVQDELDAIKASAIVMGNFMKAPNGKDTNLTEEQWLMVRTKNFREWFGDWINDPENASKVVDENGEPKVVYHGSPNEFTAFDRDMIGETTDPGFYGQGFYFAVTQREARGYGENVINAFINLKNPIDLNEVYAQSDKWDGEYAEGAVKWWYGLASMFPEQTGEVTYASIERGDWTILDLKNRIDELALTSETPFADAIEEFEIDEYFFDMLDESDINLPEEFTYALMAKGYDGVINAGAVNNEIVAFYPNQIKSATDNTGEFSAEDNDIRFRIRTKPAPKKTGIGYKVFYLKDGKLYPPMVANQGGVDTPVGVWLDAEEGTRAGESKTGRPKVKQGGKGTQGGSGTLAYRPGWHLGEIPYAIQFNRKDENGNRTLFPADFIWAEVEYANDIDYQEEAMSYGMNANGKFQHSLAGLPKLPTDGSYRYRTNPNPETDPWIITGAMKVNRLLTPSEVDQVVIDAGREPQKRQDGAVTDEQIEALNKELGLVENKVSFRVNENPTEAQKEAGNYKMGHLNLDGYRITIENPKGSVRRGTDSKGNAWENTLNNDYGYIRGTEGVDGDHIDVYLSDNPSEGNVFVVDQVNPETREFDEHKVMYGFNSAEEAREAYLANFSEGWDGLGTITEVTKDEFKKWIQSSHRKTKPFSEYKSVKAIGAQSEGEEIEDYLLPSPGTPTEDIVAEGVSLSPAQLASLAGDIFAALPEDSRKKITDGLNGNILGLQDAILQIPTSLATKENWNDEDRQVAEVVAEQMTKAAGKEMTRPFSASEALWTLYNAVNKSTDLVSEASRALVRRNLGFDSQTLEMEQDAKDGVRFRTVGDASANAQASMYNRGAANVWTRLKESFVDMNASVEELVKAIEKRSGKTAQGFENILMALNQQSSKGLAAMEAYEQKFLNKMFDEIRKIMDKTDFRYEDIVRYVILKHGLERNTKLAQRDAKAHYQEIYDDIIAKIKGMNPAQKRTYLTNAQLRDADAKAELASLQAVNTSILTDDQKRDHKKELVKAKKEAAEAAEHLVRAQKIATMTEQDALNELDKIFKKIEKGTDSVYKEMRKNDYSGISSMFYDTLGVNRKDYATEEEYQAALMQAKADKYDSLADIEAAAEREVAEFENNVSTDNLWKSINAATKETLRQQYEANMISKDQYDNLRNMFEFYVPLRGFKDNTAEDMYTYYRRPNSTGYTKPILGAEGRKTEAESPFGWIAAMAGSAIASNVKNEAKLALYYFVANRPDNGVVTLSRTWFVHTPGDVDANGKRIFRPDYPKYDKDLSTDDAKQAHEDWQEQMRELQKQGLAYEAGQRLNLGNSVVNISDTNKPEHIVTVKVGGKDYTIVINGNPRAAQAINGDINIEATAQDYSSVFGPILRWMSSVNTSYNPEFWITNLMRDVAFTMMAVNIKGDAAYRRKFYKNYPKAFKVVSLVAKNEKGTIGDSYIEQQYKDFVKYGGVTGYTQIKDSETWEKEIENYLTSNDPDSIRSGKVMRGMKSAFHGLHRFGESLEQVSRFAAFLTARETGKSVNEAVNDAKEITVNFNRKGSGKWITLEEAKYLTDNNGQPLSKLEQWAVVGISSIAPLGRRAIMFFNAAIQGLNATYKLYAKDKTKAIGWALGYAAVGMMNAVLHAMLDDDDDYLDIPQYERRTSLMIGGNGAYFKWALPQEARAFYALGDLAVESFMGRNPHQSVIGEALKISTELLPINPSEGWKAFMPSVAVPAFELALNEDYKGSPIYNEQKWLTEEEKKRSARWSKAYSGTGDLYIGIARVLNAATGGDEHDAGLINIQPEKMEHIVQSAFGGTIRTADKFINTIMAAIDPEEDVTIRQFPFLNRLLTINDERYRNVHVNDVYDYYSAEAEHTIRLEKQYTKDRDADALKDLRSSDEYKWATVYSRYKKPIKKYQEAIRAADNTNERMELMKQQDELKRKMIKEISEL